ncbi:MAG: hypothetical protein WD063_09665 [Pirellulales bacterium]
MPATAGATQGAAPADYAANAAAPQQGPYSENYTQPPAGPAQAYPATGYPATSSPNSYPPGGQSGATSAPPNAGDPYANVGSYGGAGAGYGAPPADNYTAPPPDNRVDNVPYQPGEPSAPEGYRTADSRHGAADPHAAQPEQSAADRYGASDQAEPPPPNAAPASSPPGEPYRPGSTLYNPGQTGYSPPGVPPYQMPAQTNVVSPSRTAPYYRPGGTSDFVPTTGATTPSPSTDRYNTPAIGYGQADPYAH